MRAFFLLASLAIAGGALVAQTSQNLYCGTPMEGAITADSRKALYSFMAEANELEMVRVTSTLAVTVAVYDPSGAVVAPRPGPRGSFPEYNLPYAGEYKVAVQAAGTNTGTFRIVRARIDKPCSNAALNCGSVLQDQISAANQVQGYQFTGTKDDVYSVRLVKTAGDAQTRFLVLVYDGARNIVTDSSLQIPQPDARYSRIDVKLSATGPSTILVMEYSGARTGGYSLGIVKLNGPCNGRALACGSALDASLSAPLSMNAYSIPANAGDSYLLRAVRTGGAAQFQPYAEIRDPQGNPVAIVPTRDATRFQFSAAAQGTYTVIVSDAFNWQQTGTYALSLARLNNPCNTQPVGCGAVADGRIDGALRFQTYSIDAQAGDAFLLKVLRTDPNNGFKPMIEIYDPRGTKTQMVTATDLSRLSFKVDAAGTYTLIAMDGMDGMRSGAYTLSLVRLNRPCNATPLNCGSTVTGAADRPLAYSTFLYSAGAGSSFTARMVASGAGQPALEIYDPQGNAAGAALPGTGKGIDVARPAAGNYVILVSDDSRSSTGSFLLQLFSTRGGCAATPPRGQSVSGVVGRAAPFSAFKIAASAGDALLLRSAGLASGLIANMDLYDPDGVRLQSGTLAISRKLAAAGVHTVVIGASDAKAAGNYAFSWQLLNSPAGTTPLGCGQTFSSSLAASAQFRYFSVDAEAGDTLKLLLSKVTNPLNAQMELFDSAGARLAVSGAAIPEINRKLADSGPYLVLVSPATASAEIGAFSLAMQKPNSPCSAVPLECGQTVLRSVETPGQLDAFTFGGNAGDRVTLRMPARSGSFAAYGELYDTGGTLLQSSGGANQLITSLTATGRYTLLVRDRTNANTGAYRVSLQKGEDSCAVDDKEPPTVRLRRPTGGEVIPGGLLFRIAWESDDNIEVASHSIRLSTDGGATFPVVLAANLSGTVQSYDWQAPADIAPTRSAVMEVSATDRAGNTQSARSDPLALIGSGFKESTSVNYQYDGLNRIVVATWQNGTTVRYTYDPAGNLVQVTVTQ